MDDLSVSQGGLSSSFVCFCLRASRYWMNSSQVWRPPFRIFQVLTCMPQLAQVDSPLEGVFLSHSCVKASDNLPEVFD